MRRDKRANGRRGALVIGGDYRGLGIVRSLGRHNIPVWVLTDEHLLAAASRYARHHLPWPSGTEQERIDYLLDLATRYDLDGWEIFPTGDETAALLARHRDALAERYCITTPTWEAMQWAYDKRLTYALAAQLDIAYPQTWYPRSSADLQTLQTTFPAILKPAIKQEQNEFTHAKAWRVGNQTELERRYHDAIALVDPDIVMVQELVPGGGETQYSYAALCVDGRACAEMVARRTRQYPTDFGRSSSFVESVDQREVEELGRRLLAAINYTGLVEVEFKCDPRDGRFKLLDINPRLWGWHSLGQRAGVDFPYLLWQLLQGETVPNVHGNPNVQWVRMVMDLPAAVDEMRHGSLSPRAYLRSFHRPLEFAIFAADDPLPAFAELPLLSLVALKRGVRH